MRDAIATWFPQCTVLSVMHRLDSIRTYDRVVVLHQGEMVECDSPDDLLGRADSRLSGMYKAGGYDKRE